MLALYSRDTEKIKNELNHYGLISKELINKGRGAEIMLESREIRTSPMLFLSRLKCSRSDKKSTFQRMLKF